MEIQKNPKLLPTNHIVERRFKPYGKASLSIKHIENRHKLTKSTSGYDKCKELYSEFIHQTPVNTQTRQSSSPLSKASREIIEKINLLRVYNDLSESKLPKRLVKRTKSTMVTGELKNLHKIEKNKYKNLINQVIIECRQANAPKSEKVLTENKSLLAKRSYFTRNRLSQPCKNLEKIESTEESEIFSKSIEKIKTNHYLSRLVDHEKVLEKARQEKEKGFAGVEKVLLVTPILDLYKCVGFYY